MNKPTVDELLSGSSPSFAPSVATEAALDALVLETRDVSTGTRTRRPRRALGLVPGAVLAIGALTAGAVVVDQYFRVDVPIAIEYRTDTGITVGCTAHVGSSFFSPKPAKVIEYYNNHDFTGVGQRIYDYALVLNGATQGTADLLPDSVEWLPDEDFQPYGERTALYDSMLSFLVHDVVLELGLQGTSGQAGVTADCTGQLH